MKTRLALVFLVLSGCEAATGFYIYREGGTVSQARSDFFDCELAAARAVPQDMRVETTPVYSTPAQTTCYNYGYSVQCTTTGGQVYGGDVYSYDANAGLRGEFVGRCMVNKGYRGYELPVCETSSISQSARQALSGRLNPPREGACYVPITEDIGNVAYLSSGP